MGGNALGNISDINLAYDLYFVNYEFFPTMTVYILVFSVVKSREPTLLIMPDASSTRLSWQNLFLLTDVFTELTLDY